MTYLEKRVIERDGQIVTLPYWTCPESPEGRIKKTFGDNLPKIESGTILDLGCSDGKTTREIASIYPNSKVIGIDDNETYIQKAKRFTKEIKNIEFRVGDFYNLDFPADSVEAVFIMNNIYFAFSENLDCDLDCDSITLKKVLPKILLPIKENGYLLASGDEKYLISRRNNKGFSPISKNFQKYDVLYWIESFLESKAA